LGRELPFTFLVFGLQNFLRTDRRLPAIIGHTNGGVQRLQFGFCYLPLYEPSLKQAAPLLLSLVSTGKPLVELSEGGKSSNSPRRVDIRYPQGLTLLCQLTKTPYASFHIPAT
jgi:hypothetical protein